MSCSFSIRSLVTLVIVATLLSLSGATAFAQSKNSGDGYTKLPGTDEISLLSGGGSSSSGGVSGSGSSSSSSSGSNFTSQYKNSDNGDGAVKLVRSIWTPLFNLLRIVMGIGAMITIVIILLSVMGGKPDTARKLSWWFAGLTLGFVLLSVLQGLMPMS